MAKAKPAILQSAFNLSEKKEEPQTDDISWDIEPESVRTLVKRIKDGHIWLWEVWKHIKVMKEGSTRDSHLIKWDEGKARIGGTQEYGLCDELMQQGYNKCLYKVEPSNCCIVCPVNPWVKEKCLCQGVEL